MRDTIIMYRDALAKCRSMRFIVKMLKPTAIDLLLFRANLNPVTRQSITPSNLMVTKKAHDAVTNYRGYIAGIEVHSLNVYRGLMLMLQFGYGKAPVIGDCVTHPSYQRRGIYTAMLMHVIDDLAKVSSATHVFILVSPKNPHSIQGIERSGFQFAARLRGVRIGPFLLDRSVDPSNNTVWTEEGR